MGLHAYFGGKNRMSSWIYSNIPKNINSYIEVFSGSFAVYFNEDFSHCNNIVYNDANKLQSNFILCCKDSEKMANSIEESLRPGGILFCGESDILDIKKYYRDLYTDIKNPNKSDFYDNLDFGVPNYEKAVMYSFMITSSFNGCHARGAGFSGFSKNNKLNLNTLIGKLKKPEFNEKLNYIKNIENMDFEDVINKYDSIDSYLYLDPPYRYTDGVGTHDKDYGSKNIFGDDSHERLSRVLGKTLSRWSLSYYWFSDLEKWYPRTKYRWVSKEFSRTSASFSNNTKGTELLIMNYDEKGIKYE